MTARPVEECVQYMNWRNQAGSTRRIVHTGTAFGGAPNAISEKQLFSVCSSVRWCYGVASRHCGVQPAMHPLLAHGLAESTDWTF